MLTDAQVERYSRQIVLPEIGARGQERLLAARVALAGDAATIALVRMLLERAGIGSLDADPIAADVAVHLGTTARPSPPRRRPSSSARRSPRTSSSRRSSAGRARDASHGVRRMRS